MRPISRDKEAVPPAPADEVPFETLRRSPRHERRGSGAASGFDAGVPVDPAEASKTRARRRLIGAIALAVAAIVFVPMLFDRTPVAPAGDIGLSIPDRDSPFEARRGVPDAGKGPLKPSSELPATAPPAPVADASPGPDAPPSPPDKPSMPSDGAVDSASKPAASAKPADRPTAKAVDKPKAETTGDDPRAIAALEGKAESEAAAAKTYAVQIAAFSAADKAKGLRDQLVASGLRSYTESVSTAQGLRTRVRLGPFPSREAADKAKQKLKTMKLDGSVVPL